jgi:hypothetical protein
VPDARDEAVTEYFQLLIDGITSVHNKLHQTIPAWVDAYKFVEETELQDEKIVLLKRVAILDERLALLTKYKASLIHSGPLLVSDVSAMLEVVLGLKVDTQDEFREDIKLLGEDGKVIGVCEIKGINRGIKRENINQTDSHRERSGFDSSFPALLIANTNIKSARSIVEKDQEIAVEQVKHAAHMRVLVMRTIDLLGLLRLVLMHQMSPQEARSLVLSSIGWLRVQADNAHVLNGQ